MTKNEKDLLLQDICSRLPYGVKVQLTHNVPLKLLSIQVNGTAVVTGDKGYPFEIQWGSCKPYLFPLSSMTAEQKTSHNFLKYSAYANPVKLIDWYIKNHFDYRGLIPMGLAIDATGLNIY